MDYKLYPNLPSTPPENPQVVYHLSIIQAKMQGLKNKEQMFNQKYEKYNKILNRLTIIRLFEDASLIEDAPNLQPYFPCKELQVMKNGKLPNRRRTPLLEYFMSSF